MLDQKNSDAAVLDKSGSFAASNKFNDGREDIGKRLVDTPPDSPPAPCLESKDSSGNTSVGAF